jgi:hypothetical protein
MQIRAIQRPAKIHSSDVFMDLMWSDPNEDGDGLVDSDRGAGHLFGADVVRAFCALNGVDVIVRGHQCVPKGIAFFAGAHCITVFSATNYCSVSGNDGGMLHVIETPDSWKIVPKYIGFSKLVEDETQWRMDRPPTPERQRRSPF